MVLTLLRVVEDEKPQEDDASPEGVPPPANGATATKAQDQPSLTEQLTVTTDIAPEDACAF